MTSAHADVDEDGYEDSDDGDNGDSCVEDEPAGEFLQQSHAYVNKTF